jgi:hypothetical protein
LETGDLPLTDDTLNEESDDNDVPWTPKVNPQIEKIRDSALPAPDSVLRHIHLYSFVLLNGFFGLALLLLSPALAQSIYSPAFFSPRSQGISYLVTAILSSRSLPMVEIFVQPRSLLFISMIFNCLATLANLSYGIARSQSFEPSAWVYIGFNVFWIFGIFRYWKEWSAFPLV